MFDRIIDLSLRRRLLVLALAATLLVWGGWVLTHLPVDVFPDLNRPTVTIMSEAQGLAPEEVEQLVTRPLEAAMNGLPGVGRVRSSSGVGLSVLFVEFTWGTDPYRNRQMVAERLSSVSGQIPSGIAPVMAPMASIMGEIMLVGLTASSSLISPMDLRGQADWVIRPRLLAVAGVAQVIPIGGEVRQFQVLADPARLSALGIGFDQLTAALAGFARNSTGGYLEQGDQEFLIRNLGQTDRLEDLKNAVVTWRQTGAVTVEQVADVRLGPAQKRGDGSINGRPAVILAVQKQPGANSLTLTRDLEQALAGLARTLPPGMALDHVLFKQADFIQRAVDNVTGALVDGAVLVTLVLFAFLMNVRTTAISLTAIPLSVVMTALVFHFLGLSINTMTLGGLAVAMGELVDDAVVDVENILRRLKDNARRDRPWPALRVVRQASAEVRNSIVHATIVVVLVFLPLFALSGIEGRLFAPLGLAYVVSILASLLVSLTVTPVLCLYLLPRARLMAHPESWLVRRLKNADRHLLAWSFDHARPLIAGAAVLAVLAALSVPFLGRTFLPPFNEGTVTVTATLPPGTSLTESNRIGTLAEQALLEVPEVRSTGRRTGRAELDEHAEGVHYSEIDVDLAEGRPRAEILADLRHRLARIPGLNISVGQPISHRLDHLLSGVRAQIAIKIFGDDLTVLRRHAAQIRDGLADLSGLTDLQLEQQVLIPQIQIRLDRFEARKYGLSLGQVTESLEAALMGRVVSQVMDGQRTTQLVVRLAQDWRQMSVDLGQILIDGPAGKIPLNVLAQVVESQGPNLIHHDDMRRRMVVSANVQGRDVGSVAREIGARLDAMPHPPGLTVTLDGQFRAQQQASQLITVLGGLSLAGIFLSLWLHFRSIRLTLIILGAVPMALVGAVAALWLGDRTLSVASLVGFITLIGIAARNGIMKISHYRHLMAREGYDFGKEMIIQGSLERLVPVLMTALVAALALVPLVLSSQQPGREILHPVAVVIFGGLVSSTILDTLLTPVLFLKFARPLYAQGKSA